jgi:hypothetical protein
MKKISREEAVRLGLKRYFTGVPCNRGHICERCVNRSGGGDVCAECNRERRRLAKQRQKARDPEGVRLRDRLNKQKQRARDPERIRQQWREWSARQKARQTRRAEAEMENGPIS